jgi:hypothetical protein
MIYVKQMVLYYLVLRVNVLSSFGFKLSSLFFYISFGTIGV